MQPRGPFPTPLWALGWQGSGQAIKLWQIQLSPCTKRPCVTSCLVWPLRFPAVTMRMCHQEQPSPTPRGLNRLLEEDPSQHGVSQCLAEFLSPLGLCALHPICAGHENLRHSSSGLLSYVNLWCWVSLDSAPPLLPQASNSFFFFCGVFLNT